MYPPHSSEHVDSLSLSPSAHISKSSLPIHVVSLLIFNYALWKRFRAKLSAIYNFLFSFSCVPLAHFWQVTFYHVECCHCFQNFDFFLLQILSNFRFWFTACGDILHRQFAFIAIASYSLWHIQSSLQCHYVSTRSNSLSLKWINVSIKHISNFKCFPHTTDQINWNTVSCRAYAAGNTQSRQV